MNFDVLQAPSYELARSPAAAVVGRLAEASGLLMSHFEHRTHLELPEQWLPADRPDLGALPQWTAGVLPEPKYQSFRHDQLIGSFHPGHRAKWTAHELCHGLLGFAWKPGAGLLFHALAARLAEALPVALWYFFDEVDLQRCSRHAGAGPLFGTFCQSCEDIGRDRGARARAIGARTHDFSALGAEFLERELDAIRLSAQTGRLVSHRLATLDLASDGLAYAAAHGARLQSPVFAHFVDLFFDGPLTGHHADLDSLEARTRELWTALCGGAPARPLVGGRALWMAQDVGWRLLTVLEETDGEVADALLALVHTLAATPHAMGAVVEGYVRLAAEYVLPEPSELFAVGYTLPGGFGRSTDQILDGLRSGLPATMAQLGELAPARVAEFVAQDVAERRPLGARFSEFLGRGRALGDLAAYESAIAYAPAADLEALTLGPAAIPLALNVPLRLSSALLRCAVDAPLAARGGPLVEEPTALVVLRGADGDVEVLGLDAETATALEGLAKEPRTAADLGLSAEILNSLVAHGVVAPLGWGLAE